MTIQVINNGESGLVVRGKINDNFSEHSQAIADNSVAISTEHIRVDDLTSTVADHTVAISNNSSAIDTERSRIDVLRIDVDDNTADISTANSDISSLQTSVSTNTSDIAALSTSKVAKSGDTMTGNLTVPSINTGQLAGFRNKIINGKMDIAQRGTSFSVTSNIYTLDRWIDGWTTSAVATVSQQADAPTNGEFQNSYRLTVTTADTSVAAGDQVVILQPIEGYNVRDLIGKTFTLSFWVRSSKIGKHCIAFRNSGLDRSYIAEYTVSAANTWEYKTITVTGGLPTTGTWNFTNGVGVYVNWALMSGTTYQAPSANTWQTGNYVATSGIVNCLDTVGNIFAITGVQLEAGPIATPYEHRYYGTELSLCQRYYIRSQNYASAAGTQIFLAVSTYGALVGASAWMWASTSFPVTMRVAPTVTTSDGAGNTGRIGIWTSNSGAVTNGVLPYSVNTTKDGFNFSDYNNSKYGIFANYQADAELY